MRKIVSIIMPTFNGAHRIGPTIESVLNQSYNNWELLVIDDGSTDNTEEAIKQYSNGDERVVYLKNYENLGIQKSLNRGLREARGEYIARIDDDDRWIDNDKLKRQIEFLDENQDYVLVGTGAIVKNENEVELFKYLNPEQDLDIRNKILLKNCFIHASVMFHKSRAMIFDGYSESSEVKNLEDYDLWLKMGTIGKVHNLPIYAVGFMVRGDSISAKNKFDQFKKNIRLIKRYKNIYQNYTQALTLNYLRLIAYPIFKIFPIQSIKNKLVKIYKNY